jgi:uncharacterized membrane protein (DUF2068 family)
MRSPGIRKENGGFLLALIVWEMAIKGTLLILLGIGLLSLAGRDVGALMKELLLAFSLDVDNHYVRLLVSRLDLMTGKTVVQLSGGTILFGVLYWVQAVGLYYKRRWAEFLTTVSVGIFIPVEIYHFHERWNGLRVAGVLLNVLIVVYLYSRLRRGR